MGMGMGRAVEDGKCESVGVSVVTTWSNREWRSVRRRRLCLLQQLETAKGCRVFALCVTFRR